MALKTMKRVVVVEDDQVFMTLVNSMLSVRGYQAVSCLNMEEGLEMIGTLNPAFAVVDVFLPGMGGLDGICQIKTRWPRLPCLAVSAGWGALTAADALTAMQRVGVDAVLAKPFDSADFDRALADLWVNA